MAPPLLNWTAEKIQDGATEKRFVFIHAVLRRSPDETLNYAMDDDPGDGRGTWPPGCRKRPVAINHAAENHSGSARTAAGARAAEQDAAGSVAARIRAACPTDPAAGRRAGHDTAAVRSRHGGAEGIHVGLHAVRS